jgi:hypothetical protein
MAYGLRSWLTFTGIGSTSKRPPLHVRSPTSVGSRSRPIVSVNCLGCRDLGAAGVRFGRKHKLDAYQRAKALKRLGAGGWRGHERAVAKSYRVSVPTIWRLQEAA